MQEIDLDGCASGKLASYKQVLQVPFYNMRFVYHNKSSNAIKSAITISNDFWEQFRILEKFRKKEKRTLFIFEQERIRVFNKLDDLFGTSNADALETITIEEYCQFFKMQGQKGRPGCMAGIDTCLSPKSCDHRSGYKKRKRKNANMKIKESSKKKIKWV